MRIRDLPVRQEVDVYVPMGDAWSLPAAAPAAEAAPAVLPTTATQVPLFALLGGLLLLLGGAVSFLRSRL